MYFSLVALVLTKALLTEVCAGLNVTVDPGPVVMVTESDNLTLSCLVSQRKRTSGVLVLRWFFSPAGAVAPSSTLPPTPPPPPPPPPSPRPPASSATAAAAADVLIVRMGIKKMKQYGNYTRRFPQPKFRLEEERAGEAYRLLIVNVTREEQGVYTCRVQEIRRHRNIWRASSNGTGSTTLAVHFTLEDGSRDKVISLFSDLYLCAVLICCLGLLSIFLFTLVLGCQHLLRRNHRLKARYLLVKCPESSSGETVTDSTCSSSSSPRTQRKESIRAPRGQARPKLAAAAAQMPPRPEDPPQPPPPLVPMKVPAAQQRPRKPRRLKNQTRRSNPQRDYQEDSLTYAELELVRPRPEPPASSPSGSSPETPTTPTPVTSATSAASTVITAMDTNTDTVYAQILFQEKQL